MASSQSWTITRALPPPALGFTGKPLIPLEEFGLALF